MTNASDSTAPTILNTAPSADAVVAPSASITVTFDEPLDATTVSAATFELRDSENDLVPSAISYVSSSNRAVLTPSAPLDHLRAYSAHVRGGAGGVTDLAGNPLAADYAWTFNTGAQGTTSPDVGPGGPILVVSAPGNPFSRYYAEILRAEGLNAFAVMDVSDVTLATLADYDVVVLGNIPLTSTHVTMFTTWVNGGGRLIAMRPDKQLASLLGLDDAGAVLSDQYLMMDTASGPGAGLVAQTIQFHGEADLYTVSGATALATLYSSATESASRPAVTLRHVGSRGGQAAAFTYDLARSVVYTRQGNPAWAGQERDGTSPVRATDMFWGGGTAPDWVDLSKVAIPQADEQQRLLANLILQMNVRRRPLPRFWYLPRGAKAAVVMTGDEHGNGGTVARFEAFLASSAAGCSVDDWECVRASSYVYPTTLLSREDARALDDQGFEIGIHVNTGCADFTATSVNTSFATQITQWSSKYSTLRSPSTTRTHCIPWSDWSSHVLASARNGIRLDTNYYYWPAAWAANSPGLFTGSGMPMRFADQTGAMLDVYQATTQITDESGQFVPATINALLNRALGPEGYYGVFTANMHNDLAVSWGAGAIVEAAQTRGVPIVSARQMLEWLDGRNASSYRNLSWNGTVLSFRIERGAGARGLMAMVPGAVGSMHVGSITADGTPIAFTHQTIKGVAYVTFPVASAVYHVTYAAPPGTEEESLRLRGTVTAADTHSPLANVTVSVFHANGTLAASAISDALGAYRTGPVGLGAYYVRTSNQQSYVDEAFSGIACRPDCVVTAGTPIEVTGEPIAPIDFALAPVKAAMIYPAANAIGVVLTRNFEWTPVPLADAYILHIGTAPNTWDVLAAGLLTQPSFRVTTTLPTDRTLYTRVGARVAGVWRFAESIPFTAASTRPSLVYPTANATDVLLTRDFEWTPVPGADAYILYVGTAAGTWDVLAAGLLTHHTYRVAALPIDRQLYATVGARVGGVWRFGTSVPFTAARMTAALRYPTANAAGVLLTRDFEWTPVPGADAYILHIGTAPNTWDVLAAGLLTQPSFRVTTTLPADRTLYTRVGSRLGGVWRFGETVAFTAAPVIPTLLYPAANATEVMLTRNFEWTSVPGADAYILHIGTTPNGWNLVAVGLLTQPTYHVTAILPSDRTLYVRAGARVGGLWRFSDSVPFTAARAVASLLYPIENATDVVLTRNFEWTPVPGGDAYILHIGTAPNTWDVLAAGLLTDVSYHVTQTLPSDRTLYARVATRLGGIWRFGPTTAFTAARRTPALLYPTANATGVVATRDFEWTPVPGADAYILHIGTAPNTWDVVAAGLLPGTTYRVTTTLPTDRPLYARVGARLGGIWRFADSILFNAAPQ